MSLIATRSAGIPHHPNHSHPPSHRNSNPAILRRNFISSFLTLIPAIWASASNKKPETLTEPPTCLPRTHPPISPSLAHWLRIPHQPLLDPKEILGPDQETAAALFAHLHNGTPITIIYHGGSQPGTARAVTPVLLFQKIPNPYVLTDQAHPFDPSKIESPPTYLLAHCHLRKTTRTFRLDRINI